jgi:hypothetical protein
VSNITTNRPQSSEFYDDDGREVNEGAESFIIRDARIVAKRSTKFNRVSLPGFKSPNVQRLDNSVASRRHRLIPGRVFACPVILEGKVWKITNKHAVGILTDTREATWTH